MTFSSHHGKSCNFAQLTLFSYLMVGKKVRKNENICLVKRKQSLLYEAPECLKRVQL